MRVVNEIKPTFKVAKTTAQNYNQGITYNEAGLTYNEVGYAYGGVYGQQDVPVLVNVAKSEKPSSLALRTEAQLNDEGITYNEAGVIYNDTRYAYGGIYGFQNVVPLMSLAGLEKPRIVAFGDIYTPGGTAVSQNMSIGPGWFMYITH